MGTVLQHLCGSYPDVVYISFPQETAANSVACFSSNDSKVCSQLLLFTLEVTGGHGVVCVPGGSHLSPPVWTFSLWLGPAPQPPFPCPVKQVPVSRRPPPPASLPLAQGSRSPVSCKPLTVSTHTPCLHGAFVSPLGPDSAETR